MLKYQLDTNMCIFTIKNKPPHVREKFNLNSSSLCISTITLCELIHGAEISLAPELNVRVIEGFIARINILSYDSAAAVHSGQIMTELSQKNIQMNPFDIMIAGHARSKGLIIASNNARKFDPIKGLRVENWS
ncbi:tRNA(fMet)-specific endonuclease VapC [Serratia nevei]|uniref:tRNA(fMet)-specific endonuclease VapC n=1 Tax=Serratia nevei TaxID=2703794 RepID=UPI0028669559|nr:tRNA(fMet)-specific endonuclease VapC [Serratia nevei]MDR8492141.1 tRNA(fMet)-specific endonuclease VapC [Serratia nevei]